MATDTDMYAYGIWEGRLERCRIVAYNPTTERFTAVGYGDSRHFLGSFDSEMYFKTPEEAIKAEHDGYLEGVHEARQEVLDSLAAYKTIRKMARMSLEEFSALVPKAY